MTRPDNVLRLIWSAQRVVGLDRSGGSRLRRGEVVGGFVDLVKTPAYARPPGRSPSDRWDLLMAMLLALLRCWRCWPQPPGRCDPVATADSRPGKTSGGRCGPALAGQAVLFGDP